MFQTSKRKNANIFHILHPPTSKEKHFFAKTDANPVLTMHAGNWNAKELFAQSFTSRHVRHLNQSNNLSVAFFSMSEGTKGFGKPRAWRFQFLSKWLSMFLLPYDSSFHTESKAQRLPSASQRSHTSPQ